MLGMWVTMEGTEVRELPFMQGAVEVVQLAALHAGVYVRDVEGGLCRRARLIVHTSTATISLRKLSILTWQSLGGSSKGHSTDHAGTKPLPVCCCRGSEGIC